MVHGNDGNYRKIKSFGFERNIYNDFVDATVGKEQKAIWSTEDEVAQNDLSEAFDMFEKHCLALPVRANNEVVIRKREFDNGMEARKTAMARKHLFNEDARVTRAKEVDQSISGDSLCAYFSGMFDRFHLRGLNAIEDRFCLSHVIKCRI
jgi:hypothetical protein